ncbi:hypothetical protein D4764_13G0010480 [Takifugu flavidus]|uniref:Uncharacterized protein n=1 Tax=Takifugu flavidus TaxID=433684 RepID=A0A5C6PB02_9TELE|nr:hypothetical protein D4764_13G0010480 [Takifugu flavidus]
MVVHPGPEPELSRPQPGLKVHLPTTQGLKDRERFKEDSMVPESNICRWTWKCPPPVDLTEVLLAQSPGLDLQGQEAEQQPHRQQHAHGGEKDVIRPALTGDLDLIVSRILSSSVSPESLRRRKGAT